MKITVQDFVQEFKDKKIIDNRINDHAVADYIEEKLEIKTYLPFNTKRQIAEMVVNQNITEVDGIKKYDSINGYIGLIVASIMAHTSLIFSSDPVADYDLIAESGLLPQIIAEFQSSHAEIDLLLHMALDMELEDNEINAMVGRFLNKVSEVLDSVVEVTKDKFANFDLKDIFGSDIKPEDLAKLTGLLDKLK